MLRGPPQEAKKEKGVIEIEKECEIKSPQP